MDMVATSNEREPRSISDVLDELDTLDSAIELIQRQACRITRSAEALCIVLDWARGAAWTLHGDVEGPLRDLAQEVASTGRRQVIGTTVFEPVGALPARAVLLVRRHATRFSPDELAALRAVASGADEELEAFLGR